MIDAKKLREILPQDHPFLMIDKVLEYKEGKSLTAVKNITGNEWSVIGSTADLIHFPETLVIETVAQSAIVLYKISQKDSLKEKPIFFLGKTKASFFKVATPGDQLIIRVSSGKMLKTGGYMNATVSLDKQKIAEIEIFYSVKSQ